MHVDARDFIRGIRPWDQFLGYCDQIAQEQGGRFWAAQLSDPRYEAAIEQRMAEAGDGNGRPPMEGDTPEVRALRNVANQIRLLIGAITQQQIELIEGPEGPIDRINMRRKALSDALVDAALGVTEVSGAHV